MLQEKLWLRNAPRQLELQAYSQCPFFLNQALSRVLPKGGRQVPFGPCSIHLLVTHQAEGVFTILFHSRGSQVFGKFVFHFQALRLLIFTNPI